MKLLYLGPAKTFSEQAARKFNLGELTTAQSFEAVARGIADDSSSRGILPYYNFLEGLVQESLDLVYEYQLRILALHREPIEFSIGAATPNQSADAIWSHPKALAQCSEFIQTHWPNARLEATSSTAEAAKRVRDSGEGLSIANRAALDEFGLQALHHDVGNRKHGRRNFTDFLLVAHESADIEPATDTGCTILAVTPWGDRIGLLADILSCFQFFGLNLGKIHSRPAIDSVDVEVEPQMFYLELLCSADDPRFRQCLDTLTFRFHQVEGEGITLRVLGSFVAPREERRVD